MGALFFTMDEEIETYSPDVEKQIPLPVDNKTTGFEEVTEKDGLIATKLNEKVIIQRIAKDLYKNPSSGLRELYNNSARACRVAVKKHGEEKPLIRISMNEKERRLIISDNGLGLSKERFKKVLLELGTSDNLTAGEVGQFGMGFASYMTLSSVVVIDTRARNGDQYKMIAKDGMSFQPVGDADLEGYGTKLTMTCYETVDFPDLVHKLARIAKYSGIPTVLELEKFEYFPSEFRRGVNKLQQTTFDKDVIASKTVKEDKIEIETEDYHLIALVGMHNPVANSDHIHLLNVPIESEISMPFRWWVLNIKDERKFKPMPDRDRMTEEADKTLEGMIDRDVKAYFAHFEIHTYKEFLDSSRKNEFLWLVEHQDYANQNLRPVLGNIHNCSVRKVVYDTKSFDDGSLVYKLALNNKVVYQGYKNKAMTEKVREFESESLLITTKKTKRNHWKEHVAFMDAFGIPTARQILIDNKVKMPKMEKSEMELIGHTNPADGYYEHELVDLEDIDENFIRVNSIPMNNIIRYVKLFPSPYTFVRNAPELDEYECRDYSEWLVEVSSIVCATNKGAMTVEELAETEDVVFCDDFLPEYEAFLKNEDRVVVFGSDGLLPLALYKNPACPEIPNDVNTSNFSNFVYAKYNINFHNDSERRYFAQNVLKVKPCFRKIMAHYIQNVDYNIKDSEKKGHWDRFLKQIDSFEEFDELDVIAGLKFYEEHINSSHHTDVAESFSSLAYESRAEINRDEELQIRMMKELVLPKIFGHVDIKKMEKLSVSYETAYEVILITRDTEFEFKDGMTVFGLELKFKGFKIRLRKQYCRVEVTVYLPN